MNSKPRNQNTLAMHRRSFLEKGTMAASLLVGGTLNRTLSGGTDKGDTPGGIVQTTAGEVPRDQAGQGQHLQRRALWRFHGRLGAVHAAIQAASLDRRSRCSRARSNGAAASR